MGRLIILRGNSGSGKTTVARALQTKFGPNTMLISHDLVRMEMLHVHGAEGVARSEPLMIHLLRYGAEHSEVTIMEGILPAGKYGRLFDTAVEIFGQQVFAYYYDLPFAETLRRHRTKEICHEFGEAQMRDWWLEMDFLPRIPENVLTAELSAQDAVELIYQQVMESM